MMIANSTETQLLQRCFRTMMNAFARPGLLGEVEPFARQGELEEAPLPPCFEVVVRTLVDQAVTFAVSGAREAEATQWVSLQTHSHPRALDQADFLLVPDVANSAKCRQALLQAKPGTLVNPEDGAMAFVACSGLAGARIPGDDQPDVVPGEKTYRICVSGPGIKDTHTFFVDRTDWIEARQERGDEYPCGIDVILVDEQGHVVGIPRTTRIISVEKEGAAWDM